MSLRGQLPARFAAPVERFLQEMRDSFGERLLSVLLYGSAARGEWRAGLSDLNLLVVLDRVDGPTLRQASSPARRWWRKLGLAAVFLSPEELRGSSDVFPVEYLEIKRHHLVLHGEDPFAALEVQKARLLHQVEYELRGKLLRLRQAYLRSASGPRACAALIAASWPSVATVLRGALVASGVEPGPSRAAWAEQLQERFGLAAETLLGVEALRAGGKRPGRTAIEQLFDGYLAALEQVVEAVSGR